MAALSLSGSSNDDPRKLRELVQKASSLACHHDITSVMVGVSGVAGDLMFSEMVDYISSALRVDDGICRLTRERTVFFIADADKERAVEILERLMNGFRESFTPARDPHVDLVYFVVTPEMADLTVREVLPSLFPPVPVSH